MNDSTSNLISVRAIEDIIQIQKMLEESPNMKNVQLEKDNSKERVVFSVLKHDIYAPDSGNNRLTNLLKECDVENSFKCNEKNFKRLDMSGWDGNCGLTKYINSDVVVLENIGIIEGTGSDPDVKCWSSDSDVTVLRVKKEFRNELSNKVEWEEQRNLTDDASISSANFDWESHSLVNLAGIVGKEKDMQESLTPFTIWSKAYDKTNSSMVLMENVSSPAEKPCTPEVKVAVENRNLNYKSIDKKKNFRKKRGMKSLLRSMFSCFNKKKLF